MGHLPERTKLLEWEPGMQLRAADLNANFAVVHGWLETIMAEARAPDPVAHEAIAAIIALVRRVAALEQYVLDHERGRVGQRFLPLETGGHILRQLDALRTEVAELRKQREAA